MNNSEFDKIFDEALNDANKWLGDYSWMIILCSIIAIFGIIKILSI